MALPVDPMALPAADDDNGGQLTMQYIVDTHEAMVKLRGQMLKYCEA